MGSSPRGSFPRKDLSTIARIRQIVLVFPLSEDSLESRNSDIPALNKCFGKISNSNNNRRKRLASFDASLRGYKWMRKKASFVILLF